MSRVLVIYGENKTGKTTLAMTAPSKIAWFEFDVGGLSRAAWRFPKWQEFVTLKQYARPIENLKASLSLVGRKEHRVEGMTELWERFIDDYEKALTDTGISTIVIDPYPQLWSILNGSVLQAKQDVQIEKGLKSGRVMEQIALRERLTQIEYSDSNRIMRDIIYYARTQQKHLILIAYMDDEYKPQLVNGEVKDAPTGVRIPANWRWDRMKKELDIAVETTVVNKQFLKCEVVVSGEGLSLTGLSLVEPTWSMLNSAIKMAKGEA